MLSSDSSSYSSESDEDDEGFDPSVKRQIRDSMHKTHLHSVKKPLEVEDVPHQFSIDDHPQQSDEEVEGDGPPEEAGQQQDPIPPDEAAGEQDMAGAEEESEKELPDEVAPIDAYEEDEEEEESESAEELFGFDLAHTIEKVDRRVREEPTPDKRAASAAKADYKDAALTEAVEVRRPEGKSHQEIITKSLH